MRLKANNSKLSFKALLSGIVAFLTLSPYFLWKTFSGIDINIVAIIQMLYVAIMFLLAFLERNWKIDGATLKITSLCFVISCFICFVNGGGIDFVPARITPYLAIIAFCFLSDENKAQSYDFFVTLVVISLIPGLVIHILTLVGVSVPYSILQPVHEGKAAAHHYYKMFFGALQTDALYSRIMLRLCGMFDEPGVVGTFAGLLLVYNRFDFKDKRNIVLLISGIFSLSLAFFYLALIGIILNSINGESRFRKIVLGILLFCISVGMLFPELTNYLFSRIGAGGLYGILDGRMHDKVLYQTEMNSFLGGDFAHLLFGMGFYASHQNSNMAGSYYYSMTIYDHGFIPIFLIIFWFILLFIFIKRKCTSKDQYKSLLICSIVFISNITQRPYIVSLPYVLIFLGGGLSLLSVP